MAAEKDKKLKKAPPMYYAKDSDKEQFRMGDVDELESPDIFKTEMGDKPENLLTGKLKSKGMPAKKKK